MEFITVNRENIEKEHICCAMSNNNDCQVSSKKAWMNDRFDDGLVFLKGDVRGKCFIEYIPAEKAFVPIQADGYMYIDCLWVSGQYKGQGNSDLLLNQCIKDSKEKGKKGLVVLSSNKKRGFLSDPKYLEYKGFKIADTVEPYFVLYYLNFTESQEKPSFKENATKGKTGGKGFQLYYTHQCPFTAKYVPLIEKIAQDEGVSFESILLDSAEKAQNSPAVFTTYSLFYNGEFVTHEILSDKKFLKILTDLKGE